MSSTTKRVTKKANGKTFTDAERAAMRQRALELRAGKANGESAVLAAIAKMPSADRVMAKRLHVIVRASAPGLMPKTWYGMPAYAKADGKVVCFFQSAYKFKARYASLGFNDAALLDEGTMWPVAFALKKLTGVEEAKIRALVKKASR